MSRIATVLAAGVAGIILATPAAQASTTLRPPTQDPWAKDPSTQDLSTQDPWATDPSDPTSLIPDAWVKSPSVTDFAAGDVWTDVQSGDGIQDPWAKDPAAQAPWAKNRHRGKNHRPEDPWAKDPRDSQDSAEAPTDAPAQDPWAQDPSADDPASQAPSADDPTDTPSPEPTDTPSPEPSADDPADSPSPEPSADDPADTPPQDPWAQDPDADAPPQDPWAHDPDAPADEVKPEPIKRPKPAWKIALRFAMSKRGIPYLWGGTGRGGYDCSGLMMRAYQKAGIQLPRVAADQYGAFRKKVSWKNLKPGDLVFFSGLGHVGMVSRPGYMVNAPHTGDVVKEEPLSAWRRSVFVGAVRPDRKGVREWREYKKERREAAEAADTTDSTTATTATDTSDTSEASTD